MAVGHILKSGAMSRCGVLWCPMVSRDKENTVLFCGVLGFVRMGKVRYYLT